jgi:hypothetical protein
VFSQPVLKELKCCAEEKTLAQLCLTHKDALKGLDHSMRSEGFMPPITDSTMLQSLHCDTLPCFYTGSYSQNLTRHRVDFAGTKHKGTSGGAQRGMTTSRSASIRAIPPDNLEERDAAGCFRDLSMGSIEQVGTPFSILCIIVSGWRVPLGQIDCLLVFKCLLGIHRLFS